MNTETNDSSRSLNPKIGQLLAIGTIILLLGCPWIENIAMNSRFDLFNTRFTPLVDENGKRVPQWSLDFPRKDDPNCTFAVAFGIDENMRPSIQIGEGCG